MVKYLIPYFTIAAAAANIQNGILVTDLSSDPNFEAVASTLLDTQNQNRADLANGVTFPGVYATNINTLVWDDGLAANAQKIANKCSFDHAGQHDPERLYNGQVTGENFAYHSHWNPGKDYVLTAEQGESPVNSWFSEMKFFKGEFDLTNPDNKNFWGVISSKAGHYTAMTWASTTRVGCGMARCSKLTASWQDSGEINLQNGKFDAIFTVCRYLEAGNNQDTFFGRTFDPSEIAAECQFSQNGLCITKPETTEVENQEQNQAQEGQNPSQNQDQNQDQNGVQDESQSQDNQTVFVKLTTSNV